jgi:hypothetical protein
MNGDYKKKANIAVNGGRGSVSWQFKWGWEMKRIRVKVCIKISCWAFSSLIKWKPHLNFLLTHLVINIHITYSRLLLLQCNASMCVCVSTIHQVIKCGSHTSLVVILIHLTFCFKKLRAEEPSHLIHLEFQWNQNM